MVVMSTAHLERRRVSSRARAVDWCDVFGVEHRAAAATATATATACGAMSPPKRSAD